MVLKLKRFERREEMGDLASFNLGGRGLPFLSFSPLSDTEARKSR
jgi:hypothetical protein